MARREEDGTPTRSRSLARRSRPSAHGARRGQPRLDAPLREGHRDVSREFRRHGRATDAPRAARLARPFVRRERLAHEGSPPSHRDLEHLPPIVGARRVCREDPANRWLGRYPLKRIEAEVVRDSLLFVAGRLADRPFGPPDDVSLRPDGLVTSVAKDELWRRSVYVRQRRTQLPTILEAFDLLPMNPNCLERSTSTVATQALHLLNNAMVQKLSGAFALRIQREAGTDASALVHRAFVRALGRSPTKEELEVTREALDSLIELWLRQNPEEGEPAARLRALENICHALFNSSEFVYVD